MVATGSQVIEVHHCCCLSGLLGGLDVGRGVSEGISKRDYGLGQSCFIELLFLCVEVVAGDHVIEVHCCYCPGGLLGGRYLVRVGLGGEFLRDVVGLVCLVLFHSFSFASRLL